MKKELLANMDLNLRVRQRTLFRAFFINLFLGLVALMLTYIPVLLYVTVLMTGISPMVVYFSTIAAIALWQMLGVILFFIPAVSIWMERRSLQNY